MSLPTIADQLTDLVREVEALEARLEELEDANDEKDRIIELKEDEIHDLEVQVDDLKGEVRALS